MLCLPQYHDKWDGVIIICLKFEMIKVQDEAQYTVLCGASISTVGVALAASPPWNIHADSTMESIQWWGYDYVVC